MQIKDVTTSADKWKSILRLAGNLYRYEFDNILLIYAQRPQATLVADYDTWKKVDRYVMRGSKGIAIFPSRALGSNLRYVFDIKDTGGKNRALTWDLGGNTLKEYATPNIQEVVKVDLIPESEPAPSQLVEQNVSLSVPGAAPVVAAELLIGNITLRLYNGADEHLIQSTLRNIGGLNNAW